MPVVVRSETCSRLIASIEVSNPAESMVFCLLCLFCVGSGVCEELITRLEESFRVCANCGLDTPKKKRPWADLGCSATEKIDWPG
jgi:hypothetical protein